MKIPKKFRVGKTHYKVKHVGCFDWTLKRGEINYDKREVTLAVYAGLVGPLRSPHQLTHTFWHEATHAILHDMGHRLHTNEGFVDEFAKRLTDIVYSARF